MTRICLVRHGETDWNLQQRIQGSTDIPLNERGQAQARAAAAYLAGEEWDVLYASPLVRAYDTAAAIGRAAGISKIHTDVRLKERSFGDAEGIDAHHYRAHYRGRGIVFPGMETWEEVQERAFAALEEIVRTHPNSRILVVAHGGLIGSLLRGISGGEINPGDPPLKNACMNMLSYDGQWRIEWYNWVTPELETVPE